MDARSVLGLSALRPAFLVDLPTAQSRKSEARRGAGLVRPVDLQNLALFGDDEIDEEEEDDDEDDFDRDDGDDDGDDDEFDEDDEEEETWQVSSPPDNPLKDRIDLTLGW